MQHASGSRQHRASDFVSLLSPESGPDPPWLVYMSAWHFDFESSLARDSAGSAGAGAGGGGGGGGGGGAGVPPAPRLRHHDVVCKHWLQGLCAHQDDPASCGFLHEYDEARLPLCKYSIGCVERGCRLRHVRVEALPVCGMYEQVRTACMGASPGNRGG